MPNLFEHFRGAAYLQDCTAGSKLRLSEDNTKEKQPFSLYEFGFPLFFLYLCKVKK